MIRSSRRGVDTTLLDLAWADIRGVRGWVDGRRIRLEDLGMGISYDLALWALMVFMVGMGGAGPLLRDAYGCEAFNTIQRRT